MKHSWISFSKNNMVCFVQISQQSYYSKVFQNNMFIVFCTWVCMEMNNLSRRVKELVVKVLHSESERSQFKLHQQEVNQKVFPGGVSSKLGNSKTHKKNSCLFQIKKVFNTDNYFMENLAPSRNPCFCCPGSYCYHTGVEM